jgi:hypothetical protein
MKPLWIRAGLGLGALRAAWMLGEHLMGARTMHLEWIEPSYGLYLLLGSPLLWFALLLPTQRKHPPLSWRALFMNGLGAGLLAGMINVALFWTYTEWLNPQYLDGFIRWNVEHSTNTLEVAQREFRLPAFLDILILHPLLVHPLIAMSLGKILANTRK